MRILVVSNLYPPGFMGGYELACHQMVQALKEAGHEVRVVTSALGVPDTTGDADVTRLLELAPVYNAAVMASATESIRRHFHLRSTMVNPANIAVLGDAVEEFEPDVAYIWNLLGLGGLGVLALLAHQGIPWVWHLMDQIPRQLCGFGTRGPELGAALHRVLPGRYIACSNHVLGEIRAGGVDLGDSVQVVPNWISGDIPPPRETFYRSGTLRVMNAVGELSEPKGTHVLIEAAARLRDSGRENFVIDIYGHERDLRFRSMVYEHAVDGLVQIMGPREHRALRGLHASYDLFAFPTWAREPFAIAPIEAAVAGCVPVVTAECGNGEWMIHGLDCLKAPRTAQGFAQQIAAVLDGDVDLAGLGRRARSVVAREFHTSSVLPRVQAILEAAAADALPARGSTADFVALAQFSEPLLRVLLEESAA